MMRYKTINGTELRPSCICLGTAEMGSALDRGYSFRILDTFLDAGGNFIDTAHVYANWMPGEKSLSEKTIGKWLKERKNRSRVIISTKGAHPELETMHIPRLSRKEIVQDLDESLEYLGVDYIDLYWLHRDDENRPVSDILGTLNDQVKEGKIRYFGCSNWRLRRIKEAAEYANSCGMKSFAASQILWSLASINREAMQDSTIAVMDDETYQFHKETDMAVLAFTSQARGFFMKVKDGDLSKLKDWVKATYYNEENMKKLERIKKVAQDLSSGISAVVLAYLTCQSFTAIPIIGSQSLEQLEESLEAADLELSLETVRYLEGT